MKQRTVAPVGLMNSGLMVREYFAVQALAGILARTQPSSMGAAEEAIEYADALILVLKESDRGY